ncbi:MAG TPA: NUDIX hydrolase, partial [Gammaproteobacteria bacterium]|nr:NUDIX hydrolase [Gammaproteobacteria bacterium]
LEETGIEADPGAPFTALDVIEHDDDGGLRHHFALVAVPLAYRSGEPDPGDDAAAAGWFAPARLPDPLCTDVAELVAASRPAAGP